MADEQTVKEKFRELERRVDKLETVVRHGRYMDLHAVEKLVERDNELPNSREGFRQFCKRLGVPYRLCNGQEKFKSSSHTPYVSISELHNARKDSARTVAARNGRGRDLEI